MHIVAITGASGPILGVRLIEELLGAGKDVAVIVSAAAAKVIGHELLDGAAYAGMKSLLEGRTVARDLSRLTEYADDNLFAPIASGSARFESITVIPTSMKTLAAVAGGHAGSLITRACDVALKERRRCILVARETPLSLVHIENMRAATMAGAIILPSSPGFYAKPRSVDDIVNFIVGKVMGLLDIEHDLFKRWGDPQDR